MRAGANRLWVFEPKVPKAGFDPVNNPKDESRLGEFLLPPRPDKQSEPELFAHWLALLSGSPNYVKPRSAPEPGSEKPGHPASRDAVFHPPRPPRPHSGSGIESSRNWSGGYVTAGHGDRLLAVAGGWTVSAVRPGNAFNPDRLPRRCSIWIGLDGRAGWARSMPQVGTEHTAELPGEDVGLAPGRPMHRFWWQWWIPGGNLPYYMNGLTLEPDDPVLCYLRMNGRQQAIFHVKNDHPARRQLATVRVTGLVPVAGNSAEWIVERPDHQAAGTAFIGPLMPSPDFGSVELRGFLARGQPDDGPGGRVYTMETARLIASTDIRQDPTSVVIVGEPERTPKADGLRVTYRDNSETKGFGCTMIRGYPAPNRGSS